MSLSAWTGDRDTPNVLRDYFDLLGVESFLIGLTGTPETVRDLGRDYGLDFQYGEANGQGHYDVGHTAGMFLLDAESRWIRRYAYGTDRKLIVDDLQSVLAS